MADYPAPVSSYPADPDAIDLAATFPRAAAAIDRGALPALLLVGFFARLIGTFKASLWFDEGLTIQQARLPWRTVLGLDGAYDTHPPLYTAIVKFAALFLLETQASRAISVLAGTATVFVVYLVAGRLLKRWGAIIATAIFALAPLAVYYSREGRMYALTLLFLAVAYLAILEVRDHAARGQASWRWGGLFGLSVALALYTDYSAALALGPAFLVAVGLLVVYRRAALPLVVGAVGALVAYLPWLPQVVETVRNTRGINHPEESLTLTPEHVAQALISVTGLGGSGIYFTSSSQGLWQLGLPVQVFLGLIASAVLVLGLVTLARRGWFVPLFIVAMTLGTVATAVLCSLHYPVFAERTVMVAVIGWAILVGAILDRPLVGTRNHLTFGFVGLTVLMMLLTTQAVTQDAVKTRWREATVFAADGLAIQPYTVVSYSWFGTADTLMELYEPDASAVSDHVLISDAGVERRMSMGHPPVSTVNLSGVLRDGLPMLAPGNADRVDAFWFVTDRQNAALRLTDTFKASGYSPLFQRDYVTATSMVTIQLFVRDDVELGQPVEGFDSGFRSILPIERAWMVGSPFAKSSSSAGRPVNSWILPSIVTVQPIGDGQNELVVERRGYRAMTAFTELPSNGTRMWAATVQTQQNQRIPENTLALVCLSPLGAPLSRSLVPAAIIGDPVDGWVTVRTAVLCPVEATVIRMEVINSGGNTPRFRNPQLRSVESASTP